MSSAKRLISVKVTDPQGLGDIQTVSYTIQKSAGANPVDSGSLADDGQAGDLIAKDGVFSTLIDATFAQNDSGEFKLDVLAVDKSANESNTLEGTILLRTGPENLPPEVVMASVPRTVAFDSSFNFVASAVVTDPEGLSDIKEVFYQFFPPAFPNPTLVGELLDDGSNGDGVAGDGVFTTTLSSDLIESAADHFVRFQAEDHSGNKSRPVVALIKGRSQIDAAPVVNQIEAPTIVNVNSNREVLIRAQVGDPDGLADIDSVTVRILLPDGTEVEGSPQSLFDDGNPANSGDLVEGDGTYSAILPLANNTSEPLDLLLVFRAKDRSGLLSRPVEHILTVALDDAPIISNLVAPDTAQVDANQTTLIFIFLDVKDPQGLSDIETVQFRSFLPSGQEAMNSPTALFDDGDVDMSGDERAGDGTYSRTISLPPGTPSGNFRFVFQAFDKSAATSNEIEHILTVAN